MTRWCRCPAVFPAALFGDGLEDLGGGAPALFGGLRQVAGGQFLPALGQEPLAGLLIRLGGHGQSLGYQLRRAGGKESSSASPWVAFSASGLETGLQRLWRSIIRLLTGWSFGRDGPQRQGSHNMGYVMRVNSSVLILRLVWQT